MGEFLNHDDARRSRILEAALVEFAEKGYKKASTNAIVRSAEVSKGLLFHYFVSKDGLYVYLMEQAVKTINDELNENVNFHDKDVLARFLAATIQKVESYRKHPLFTKLFEKQNAVTDEKINEQVAAIMNKYAKESYEKICSNIDYYVFRDNIQIDPALDIVKWTIDRISWDWKNKHNGAINDENLKELQKEITSYIDLFKDAFTNKKRYFSVFLCEKW